MNKSIEQINAKHDYTPKLDFRLLCKF